MIKKFLIGLCILQIPITQKYLLLSGNFFLEPLGYTYKIDSVTGIFPFFIKINHLRFFQKDQTLLDGYKFYIDWRRLTGERLVIHSIQSEETTDWNQLYNIIEQFNFFKIIRLDQLSFSGSHFSIYASNRKYVKRFNLLSRGQDYLEVQAYFSGKKGTVSVKTLDQTYDAHVKYDPHNIEVLFKDFIFRTTTDFKKGRLTYKDHTVTTSLKKKILTLKYNELTTRIDFKKEHGAIHYKHQKPIVFGWQFKNNQIILWVDEKRWMKYDISQETGFVQFDESLATFKNFAFKNIDLKLPEWYDLKAKGWLTLTGFPCLNISVNFYDKVPVILNVLPHTFDFATDYFLAEGAWSSSEVYLTALYMQGATLRQRAKIYPFIDDMELVQNKQTVLHIRQCDYDNFESLNIDWPLYFPFMHCHIESRLRKNGPLEGTFYVKNINTPFFDKTMEAFFDVKNDHVDLKVLMAHLPFVTGTFDLKEQTGVMDFKTQGQELSVTGNDLIGNVEGQVQLLKGLNLKGHLSVANGHFENVDVGLIISNIQGKMLFENELISFEGSAEQCKLKGYVNTKTHESSYEVLFDHYTAIQSDLLNLIMSGKLSGTVFPLYTTGDITIEKAAITISETPLSQSFDLLNLTKPRPPLQTPLTADIKIKADDTIDVTAFISHSIWGGECQVKIKNNTVGINGSIIAERGQAELLGHTMILKHGSVIFAEPDSLNPKVDIAFERSVEGKILQASLIGRARNINDVLFTSVPAMPRNEVISYLLFSTNVQRLSVAQIARLGIFLGTFNIIDANSGLQKVMNTIDFKNTDNTTTGGKQILTIGKRFHNTTAAVEYEIGSRAAKLLLEQALTNNLSLLLDLNIEGEATRSTNNTALEVMLRYMRNY